MPLLDLTPYLMGDPAAAFRRAPTEQEMNRARWNGTQIDARLTERRIHEYTWHPRSKVLNLNVGDFLKVKGKTAKTTALKTLRKFGMAGVGRRLEDGFWQVVRTA